MGKIITCRYCGTTKEVRQHADTCGRGICRMRKHREALDAGKTLEERIALETFEDLAKNYKAALDEYRVAQEEADELYQWVGMALKDLEYMCGDFGLTVSPLNKEQPVSTVDFAKILNAKYGKKE